MRRSFESMSILRIITGLWKNQEETSERAKSPQLKTRYYKERFDKVMEAVTRVINSKPDWKVFHIDKERGEIMVETKNLLWKSDLIISVFKISPTRSAIDVLSAKRGTLGDLGTSYFNILAFYKALHKEIKPE